MFIMGFRQIPHFIIAIRGFDKPQGWILRATIDSDIFNRMVRTVHTGKYGDAFIINKQGIYQTTPRFADKVLEQSNLDPSRFGESGNVVDKIEINDKIYYFGGAWLKNDEWLMVISQESGDEMKGLLRTQNMEILIILLGCLAIIMATVLTTHMMIKHLEEADVRMIELNAQLMQSDKLAALGKMAAGIAHEINNPLAVIGEKVGWMKDLLEDEEFQQSKSYKEYLNSIDKIELHVERARKITHNMLGFVRKMEPRLDDVDINVVINQTVELLQNHARINNIEIRKNQQPDLPIIASDQSRLQQVMLNLINNAIDAIQKNGWIEIKTYRDSSKIIIEIRDNGPGIPDNYKKKIFDPFFTTKEKGTGLGLFISFRIIEDMGGILTLDNSESGGALVTLKLPIIIPEKK